MLYKNNFYIIFETSNNFKFRTIVTNVKKYDPITIFGYNKNSFNYFLYYFNSFFRININVFI